MKLIIDIDKDTYKRIKGLVDADYFEHDINGFSQKAIANGTPLPKGHGRIADMDEAIKCIEDVEGDDAFWAIRLIEWACAKRTIIEADKESEDKE